MSRRIGVEATFVAQKSLPRRVLAVRMPRLQTFSFAKPLLSSASGNLRLFLFPAHLGTSWVGLKIGNRASDVVPISLFPLTGSRGSLLAEVMAEEAHHQVA
jgi:hypothetical protein